MCQQLTSYFNSEAYGVGLPLVERSTGGGAMWFSVTVKPVRSAARMMSSTNLSIFYEPRSVSNKPCRQQARRVWM